MIRWLVGGPGPALDEKAFLCPSEAEEGRRYRHPGRYRQWLLGRAAAKALLRRHAELWDDQPPSVKQINVRRTGDGWPQPLDSEGRPLDVSLSISHTGEKAFCALCPVGEGKVGADMERVAERPDSLLEDFYTDGERERLGYLPRKSRDKMATVVWCIKEAILKARRTGFKESAKSVDVVSLEHLPAAGWKEARVVLADGSRPEVFWRLARDGGLAMAIARIPLS